MRKLLILGWITVLLLTACDAARETVTPQPSPVFTSDRTGALPTATTRPSNTPIPTRTPANAVRLAASPTLACPDAPRTRLIIGERGRVLAEDERPLNVREGPGTDNDILGLLEVLEVFEVLDGPVCSGIYAWFYIRRGNLEGWIAEGEPSIYYVEPYLPG